VFWLIELANTSLGKDLEEKSQVYAKSQIREYWVVNLRQMELVVKRNPVDGEYRSTMTLTAGELSPLAFPDLVISVTRLLKR
jgi:Uma2 family endonuclease